MGSSKKCVCTDGGPECTAGGCAQGVRPDVRKRNDDEWGTNDSRDGFMGAGAMVALGRLRFSAKLILQANKNLRFLLFLCGRFGVRSLLPWPAGVGVLRR